MSLIRQTRSDLLKYERSRCSLHRDLSNHSSFKGTIMAEYILVNGIRVAKSFEPETFGRLTTIGPRFMLPYANGKNHTAYQVCQCECGNAGVHNAASLRRGNSLSCGCLHKESVARNGRANRTHGKTNTSEYKCWRSMKRRCESQVVRSYKDYGGRGIKVCDRWLGDSGFENFFQDMGSKPSSKHSIDRVDVNGNYCPGNCRWATDSEQRRNRRTSKIITHSGKSQCVQDWASELGIPASTLRHRIKAGRAIKDVLGGEHV
jgi:hypothetical protein